ncbi:DUF6456 domain-containing protein [Sinorhizobium meliloti]|uniref:DUF6456 domain-containing protein n=1 Tax=Rhizobium meliloti TaxID=382 RepID=UPI001295CFE0|nr:DUF6456 domain-containing protein [Sinorhizobium meliloti]MQV11224.1 hypothetical protein [Sinorhizobium meliloti]
MLSPMSAPSKIKLRPTEVPNPYFSRAHAADTSNPRTIPAVVNVRESAVTTMASRGVLDAAQVAAADRFRGLFEAMGGKGAGAIDYSREHVDGGKSREPITEGQMNAGQELARCRDLLGARLYGLVCAVAGEGRALHEVVGKGKRERLTAADMLRMGLDDLATMWRLATRR